METRQTKQTSSTMETYRKESSPPSPEREREREREESWLQWRPQTPPSIKTHNPNQI
jgi:hypothetical protein